MVRQATIEDLTIFDTYSLNHGKLTKFGVTCNVETYWSSSKGKQWNQHGDNPVAEPMEALQHVKLPYRTLPIHQCMAHPWWPNHDISAVVPPCDAPCYALLRPGAPALWGFLGTIFPGSDAISGSWGEGCFMMKRMSYACIKKGQYMVHIYSSVGAPDAWYVSLWFSIMTLSNISTLKCVLEKTVVDVEMM